MWSVDSLSSSLYINQDYDQTRQTVGVSVYCALSPNYMTALSALDYSYGTNLIQNKLEPNQAEGAPSR